MNLLVLAEQFEKSLSKNKKRKINKFLSVKMQENMNELKDLVDNIKKEELNDEDYDWVAEIGRFINLYNRIKQT